MPPPLVSTYREQIADNLRSRILVEQLEPGTPLREVALAKEYGISRGPIRDALLQLTQEGLLEARPHRGVCVAPRPAPDVRKLLVRIRRDIEAFAVGAFIDRAGSEARTQLAENLEAFEIACTQESMPEVVALDMQFHRTLVEVADPNALLNSWLPIIVRLTLPYSRHQTLMESYQEHRAIFAAIERGDKKAATQALKRNIQ